MSIINDFIMFIIPLGEFVVCFILALVLLLVMTISTVYFIFYMYDAILGNSIYKLGVYLSNRIIKLKQIKLLKKINGWIKPRENYVRYETPLFTYCFSYFTLLIIAEYMKALEINYEILVAHIIYLAVYFIGMRRKYGEELNYQNALDNNLTFLKLSFVPLTFLITVVGFLFTVLGVNLQEIDYSYFQTIINAVSEIGMAEEFTSEIWLIIENSLMILILLYILSIPMQLISYFIILVIEYFRKYARSYAKLVEKYMDIVAHFIG